METLLSYKPTAYIYVLPVIYIAVLGIKTTRSKQQGVKEGDFQRRTPCRRHAPHKTSGSKKTYQTRIDHPDNITQSRRSVPKE